MLNFLLYGAATAVGLLASGIVWSEGVARRERQVERECREWIFPALKERMPELSEHQSEWLLQRWSRYSDRTLAIIKQKTPQEEKLRALIEEAMTDRGSFSPSVHPRAVFKVL